jgi:parallel beta-helix repeat protein
MKNLLSKKFFIIFTSILYYLLTYSLSAQTKTLEFSSSLLNIEIAAGEDGITYENITYEGLGQTDKPGSPSLPVRYLNLLVPSNMNVGDISVSVTQTERYELKYPVYPAQFPIPISINYRRREFEKPDKNIYSLDVFPKNAAEYIEDGYFDGANHIVTIAVYPVRYYSSGNYLELIKSMRITLNYSTSKRQVASIGYRSSEDQEIYDSALKSIIDNPEDISSYQIKASQIPQKTVAVKSVVPFYKYVIITTSALKSSFNKFVEWKKRKGVDIGIVTIEEILANYVSGDNIGENSVINDDAGNIRKYLYDGYNSVTNKIIYALLAGSPNDIPYRTGYGVANAAVGSYDYETKVGPTDLYFSDLNGDWKYDGDEQYGEPTYDRVDKQAEIFIGRLLCRTSQEVSDWTNKLIEYEQNPFKGDFSKITTSLWSSSDHMQAQQAPQGVASSTISPIFANYSHVYIEERDQNGNLSPDSPNPSGPTGTEVINAINQGYGFYNIYNHGAWSCAAVCVPELNNTNILYLQRAIFGREQHPSKNTYEAPGNLFANLTGNCNSTITYAVACNSAQFDEETIPDSQGTKRCLADDYISLKNSGVAYLGNVRSGWISSSFYLHKEFIRQLFNNNNYHIGQAEALSKSVYNNYPLALTHNLFGDPEMPVWTTAPTQFASVTATDAGSYITVNTGVSGCQITASSADNGVSYYLSVNSTGTNYTFNTSVRPLYITVVKQNYIPYTAVTGGTLSANVTLSGNLKVLGNITVPSGKTLNISDASVIKFYNNSSLTVNGSLKVNGTASNKVTIDFISKQTGIRISSTATNIEINYADIINANQPIVVTNNTSSVYINHCDIGNSSQGVSFNYSNGEISATVIHDITAYGGGAISLYHSSPSIRNCTITNNLGACYGIAVLESSSPYIYKNTISNNSSYGIYIYHSNPYIEENTISSNTNMGIYSNYYSNPLFGDTQSPYDGRNTITGHAYGLYTTDHCNVNAGSSDMANNNMIYSNTYNSYTSGTSTVYAQNNWWGQNPPNVSKFYTFSNSYFYYSPYLTAIPYWASSASAVLSSTPASLSVDIDPLFNAQTLKIEKQYDRAVESYKKVVSSSKIAGLSEIALTEIGNIYSINSDQSLLAYLEQFTSDKYLNNEIHPTALEILANIYAKQKNEEKAIELNDKLMNEYKATLHHKNGLLNKFFIYYDQQKYELAKPILQKLQGEYSDYQEVFTASALLKLVDDDVRLIAPKNMNTAESQDKLASVDNEIPTEYALNQNYPNPFNPSTMINYDLPEDSRVTLKVYDILGREITTLVNEYKQAGRYNVTFNASHLATGIYIYELRANDYVSVKKMSFVK